MNESTFLRAGTAVLDAIESAVDAAVDGAGGAAAGAAVSAGSSIDFERKGEGVLALEFENGTQIIVNLQAPMQQIWLAAKAGGFHFSERGGRWIDTRSGEELFSVLSAHASAQSGQSISLRG